jgi:hypothetical protein
MAARGREAAHVGDGRDAVFAEPPEELREGQGRMAERMDDHRRSVAERRSMRRLVAGAAVLLLGCPAPARYAIQRPGLSCERAARVAYKTLIGLGYTVTGLVPPHPERTGQIAATRSRPDGGTEAVRVLVRCGPEGAELQPVEESLVPSYEFSRVFGYSFKSLVQAPDTEEPRAALGLETQVHVIPEHEALLDLGGSPTISGTVPVRVTVRNHTDRAVAVDPARIELVAAEGEAAAPLAGSALDSSLAAGAAGGRVRAELLTARRVPPRTTVTGYLVYPAGAYREARIGIEDVETGETEGFVAPVE